MPGRTYFSSLLMRRAVRPWLSKTPRLPSRLATTRTNCIWVEAFRPSTILRTVPLPRHSPSGDGRPSGRPIARRETGVLPAALSLVPVIPAQVGIQTSAHHAARKISASERVTFSESDFFLTKSEICDINVPIDGISARSAPAGGRARRVRGCLTTCLTTTLARAEGQRRIPYFLARNPLKRLDSET
jgi:hypothetical protein